MKLKLYDGSIIDYKDEVMAIECIKDSNPFTCDQTIDEYVKGLRKRLAQCTGKLVHHNNYAQCLQLMSENNIIEFVS